MIHRRSLIRGLGAILCAPAIVRVSSLMPISVWDDIRCYGPYGERLLDMERFIAEEVLPLARRQLVAFQFSDPVQPWITYTATRMRPLLSVAIDGGEAEAA